MKSGVMGALLVALVLVGGPQARAQNQQEMNQQAERDFTRADAQLNAVYKRVSAKLDGVGKKKLIKSERAWVIYRDAQADLEADQSRGGSMAPMLYAGTQAQLTKERIKRLRDLLSE